MAKAGRQPLINEAKRREIIVLLSVGCSKTKVARYLGCDRRTIQRTAEKDPTFAEELRQAETRHEAMLLKNIKVASNEARYWRAAAWILERLDPDHYGQRKPGTITSEQFSNVAVEFAEFIINEVKPAATRQKLLARLEDIVNRLQAERAAGEVK